MFLWKNESLQTYHSLRLVMPLSEEKCKDSQLFPRRVQTEYILHEMDISVNWRKFKNSETR